MCKFDFYILKMGLASWVCVNANVIHTGITSCVMESWKIALVNAVD